MVIIINLSIILFFSYLTGFIFNKLKLPKLLGYLFSGIIFSLLFKNTNFFIIGNYSKFIINIALTIILFKAGLNIDLDDLKKHGIKAILLGIIPNFFEGFILSILFYFVFTFSIVEAGMIGFMVSAVSPAVVIPSMTKLIERKIGSKKAIPTLNLASASLDDIVSLSMFALFLNLYTTNSFSIINILLVPLEIIFGIIIGIFIGILFSKFKKNILIYIIFAISLITITFYSHYIYASSMMIVMTIGIIIKNKNYILAEYSNNKTNFLWSYAQILLFFLIGFSVNLSVIQDNIIIVVIIIFTGLLFRGIGVLLVLFKSDFNNKQKLFCLIANIPKATIQATLGLVPLENGVAHGSEMLSISVIAIIITAPLGLILIENNADKLLAE